MKEKDPYQPEMDLRKTEANVWLASYGGYFIADLDLFSGTTPGNRYENTQDLIF